MTARLLAGAGLPLALLRDMAEWHLRRVAEREAEAEAERREWMALRESDELVTVQQAADITGRAPSTIRGWLAAGKVRRVDSGGQGVPARLRLMDVLRAELAVRGRGRPPEAAR